MTLRLVLDGDHPKSQTAVSVFAAVNRMKDAFIDISKAIPNTHRHLRVCRSRPHLLDP